MSRSIVLVGAPGSGKSEVAALFAEKAVEELGEKFVLLDDVANSLEAQLDRPVGVFGSYIENMLIAVRRLDSEAILRGADESFITVGSIIETMAHGAQNVELLSTGLQTPDAQKRVMREAHTTTVLSFLFLDSFRYNYGFYLPLGEQIEIPGQAGNDGDAFRYAIDRNIQTVFANFGLNLEELRGTPEEKAEQMLASIKAFEAKQAEAEALADAEPSEDVAEALSE